MFIMKTMSTNQKLLLRKQFQEALYANLRELWGGVRVFVTIAVSLFSVQTGFILWASPNNWVLLVIPIGILLLCSIGKSNAKHYYKAILEYIACIAKVEDELDLTREEKPSFFKDDESILCDRWIKDRKDYKTTKEFRESLTGCKLTSYLIIRLIYTFIAGLSILLIIYLLYYILI